jgi:hypothetical protein
MTRPPQLFTATMAKLYADQGYLRKAAAIYNQLVNQEPDRQDLRDALAALEAQIGRQNTPNWKELGLLIREWIALQKEYDSRNPHDEKEKP